MKNFLRQAHLWLSLPFGIIIIILCATGAILVFQTEWLKLFTPDHYYVEEVLEHKIPLAELVPTVEKQIPDTLKLGSVTISANPKENYSFSLEGIRRASVMVDPYSGKVRDITLSSQGGFFSSVLRLHRWLLMPVNRGEFSLGKFITGISTIMFLIILITGIIIWIPKNIKMLKTRLKVKWNKGTYRRWYDFHLASGIYASIFLLAFCITGLTWSFDWYRDGFYGLFGVETSGGNPHGPAPATNKTQEQQTHTAKPEGIAEDKQHFSHENGDREYQRGNRDAEKGHERSEGGFEGSHFHNHSEDHQNSRGHFSHNKYLIWDEVVASLTKEHPDYSIVAVQDGMAMLASDGAENTRSADKYTFNAKTGKITDVQYNKDQQSRQSTVRGWIYKIHVGKWAGFFSKLLSFLACIIGVALTVTGYYMYIKKKFIRIK